MGAIAGVLGHLLGLTKSELVLCIQGTLVIFALGCLNLGWFIAGQVILWRSAGKACQGANESPEVNLDETAYLFKSANAITVWIVIEYSLCGLFCLSALVYGFCCPAKPQIQIDVMFCRAALRNWMLGMMRKDEDMMRTGWVTLRHAVGC